MKSIGSFNEIVLVALTLFDLFFHHQVTYANHAEVLASNSQNAAAPQRNMRELDSLLDDLNRSRLSAGPSSGSVGHNSSGGNSNEGRPSVDALLNELSNAVHKYLIIRVLPLSLYIFIPLLVPFSVYFYPLPLAVFLLCIQLVALAF